MEKKRIKSIYFSPTGSTSKVVLEIAAYLSKHFMVPMESIDFTSPGDRQTDRQIPKNELVVFGVPTYAGRIPNKILPAIQNLFHGEKCPAIAVVTFGNRNYDSSLTELQEELSHNGFQVFAVGAFVCEHVFSERIGYGRPDRDDHMVMERFARECAEKLKHVELSSELNRPVIGGGKPVQPYYSPLRIDGSPAFFLKAKPVTDVSRCSHCGLCAEVCPMGSVDNEDVARISGICIKCQACIKKCPNHAKFFDDPDFLSHVAMLEENYMDRKKPEYYL